MKMTWKGFAGVGLAIVAGLAIGWFGAMKLRPAYEPITYVSVGVVNNKLPGFEEAALYESESLSYASALCLSEKQDTRAHISAYWREFSPEKAVYNDPLITNWEITIAAGCSRKPDQQYPLPSFVKAGIWQFEAEIKVNGAGDKSQKVQFTTTRFIVVAKP